MKTLSRIEALNAGYDWIAKDLQVGSELANGLIDGLAGKDICWIQWSRYDFRIGRKKAELNPFDPYKRTFSVAGSDAPDSTNPSAALG